MTDPEYRAAYEALIATRRAERREDRARQMEGLIAEADRRQRVLANSRVSSTPRRSPVGAPAQSLSR